MSGTATATVWDENDDTSGESRVDAFERAWNAWHRARLRATLSPLGIASLTATHWLTGEPQRLPGVPGEWWADIDSVVGQGNELDGLPVLRDGDEVGVVTGDTVRLSAGGEVAAGERRLRFFDRDGSLALRVIDPDAPVRLSTADIGYFAPDERWVVDGRFTPADPAATFSVTAIDGYVGEERLAGTVEFALGDEPVSLTVTGGPSGLRAVIADGTSGTESYRFRFLGMPAPGADGVVRVDFNRAYLPPCAFSDEYVCPLPPPNNRFATPVRAGETALVPVSADGSADDSGVPAAGA
ncbi:hypothetical protein CLV49_0053 [Labedella gwakjiensis]|uniref:DUF1684 domain-containing protein n=1 Tax=Labedella gwakjiensis TaxID=390269 RepID=A0A2P8GR82_9MICO|nr:DUF1684 domain-containing protein [Labedella gwakjiensis]PSL36462.1 hypothetical protein CLV49_0053 [Labedella gwakjiensis]RUQ85614.1 DUF1684 domain-containing protein [Labedella gwakjiensis]